MSPIGQLSNRWCQRTGNRDWDQCQSWVTSRGAPQSPTHMWEAHIRRGFVVLWLPSENHIRHKRIKPPIGGNQVISVISLKNDLKPISSHFWNPNLQFYIRTVNVLWLLAICNLEVLCHFSQREVWVHDGYLAGPLLLLVWWTLVTYDAYHRIKGPNSARLKNMSWQHYSFTVLQKKLHFWA